MTEQKQLERYRIVYYPSQVEDVFKTGKQKYVTWEAQINALAEAGYKLKMVDESFAVMELEEPSKYADVDAVKKVRHEEAEAYLSNGWRLDSVYANHCILTRRRE